MLLDTNLSENCSRARFAAACRDVESFPTLVVSALMSQIGVSIGSIVLVEGSSRDWPIVRAGWRRRVVRRLSATPPTIEQTDLGPVSVRIPRILNRSDKPQSFVSVLIKPFRRRTRHMDEVLPTRT